MQPDQRIQADLHFRRYLERPRRRRLARGYDHHHYHAAQILAREGLHGATTNMMLFTLRLCSSLINVAPASRESQHNTARAKAVPPKTPVPARRERLQGRLAVPDQRA